MDEIWKYEQTQVGIKQLQYIENDKDEKKISSSSDI